MVGGWWVVIRTPHPMWVGRAFGRARPTTDVDSRKQRRGVEGRKQRRGVEGRKQRRGVEERTPRLRTALDATAKVPSTMRSRSSRMGTPTRFELPVTAQRSGNGRRARAAATCAVVQTGALTRFGV